MKFYKMIQSSIYERKHTVVMLFKIHIKFCDFESKLFSI